MTSSLDAILALRSLDCFAELPVGRVAAIARSARSERLPLATSWNAGSFTDTALVVTSGRIVVEATGDRRRRLPVARGEAIGLVEVLAGAPSPAFHCEAESDVLLIGGRDLDDLCEDEFDAAESLLRWLADRLLRTTSDLPPGSAVDGYRQTASPSVPSGASAFVRRLAALADSLLLPEDQLDAMAELARQAVDYHADADSVIWRSGDEADSFLVLLEGRIHCEIGEGWHTHLGAYSLAGDLESLARLPRRFTARAATEITALRIGVDSFLDILEDHPRLTVAFLRNLAQRALREDAG